MGDIQKVQYARNEFHKFPWELVDDSPGNEINVFGGNSNLNQVKLIVNKEDRRVFISFNRKKKNENSKDELVEEIWEFPELIAFLLIKSLDNAYLRGEKFVRDTIKGVLNLDLNTLS